MFLAPWVQIRTFSKNVFLNTVVCYRNLDKNLFLQNTARFLEIAKKRENNAFWCKTDQFGVRCDDSKNVILRFATFSPHRMQKQGL